MSIIITIAAKVTDRPFRFQKWCCKGSHLQGKVNRSGDLILTNKVFHAMHLILSLKLGDHKGLPLFVHGRLLKRTLLLDLPAS